MTSPDAFGLTRLFITPSSVPPDPTLAQPVAGATLTAWDSSTGVNTVQVGPVTYRNLPVVSGAGLVVGPVLLLKGPAGYIIMGPLSSTSSGGVVTTPTTKTYAATGSRSYDHTGAFIGSPDGDNNMYFGGPLPGRSFGNEIHMWTFNAALIRSDLAGKTLVSAQVFLYCFQCGSSAADYNWFWCTQATIVTPCPTTGFSGSDVQNKWTTIPGWGSFDITSLMGGITANNANSIIGGPAGFSDAYSAFRGYGTGAPYLPYIQVTFK